jgi:hypothetical protein
MRLERLPNSGEEPLLFAHVDENDKVRWALLDDLSGESPFEDRENQWVVWREGDVIHVEAPCWFHPRGYFGLSITESDADKAVLMANHAAKLYCMELEGRIL